MLFDSLLVNDDVDYIICFRLFYNINIPRIIVKVMEYIVSNVNYELVDS